MPYSGTDDRRKPEGERARTLVDSLLERVGKLEELHDHDARSMIELAAILGRLEAAIDAEAADARPGSTFQARMSWGGFLGECIHCAQHERTHLGGRSCPVPAHDTGAAF